MDSPTKPPTPAEYAVLVLFFAGALTGLGALGLWKAAQATPEKAELATSLTQLSYWSLGLGFGIAFLYWLVRRFGP